MPRRANQHSGEGSGAGFGDTLHAAPRSAWSGRIVIAKPINPPRRRSTRSYWGNWAGPLPEFLARSSHSPVLLIPSNAREEDIDPAVAGDYTRLSLAHLHAAVISKKAAFACAELNCRPRISPSLDQRSTRKRRQTGNPRSSRTVIMGSGATAPPDAPGFAT